jgi:hypothetical protein
VLLARAPLSSLPLRNGSGALEALLPEIRRHALPKLLPGRRFSAQFSNSVARFLIERFPVILRRAAMGLLSRAHLRIRSSLSAQMSRGFSRMSRGFSRACSICLAAGNRANFPGFGTPVLPFPFAGSTRGATPTAPSSAALEAGPFSLKAAMSATTSRPPPNTAVCWPRSASTD